MPVSEVHHVAITVADLERSASFYESALGYTRTLRSDVGGPEMEESLRLPRGTTGRVQYLQGPTRVGQLELIEWNGETTRSPNAGHLELGTFLLSFEIPLEELPELFERVTGMGGEVLSPPNRVLLDNYGYIHALGPGRGPGGVE